MLMTKSGEIIPIALTLVAIKQLANEPTVPKFIFIGFGTKNS